MICDCGKEIQGDRVSYYEEDGGKQGGIAITCDHCGKLHPVMDSPHCPTHMRIADYDDAEEWWFCPERSTKGCGWGAWDTGALAP